MMISHSNKFIFIKTTKTAGTSVEIALSSYCGGNDVILPLRPEENLFRQNEYNKVPQNYTYSISEIPKAFFKTLLYKKKGWISFAKNPFNKPFPFQLKKYYGHMSALEIRKEVESKVWDNYFKFTIERNPWDKAISRYYWDLEYGGRVNGRNLNEHIDFLAHKKPNRLSNWNLYADQNEILVDKVLLFERLNDELTNVGRKIKLNNLSLPEYRAKGNTRKDKRPPKELLNENSIEIINQLCCREIKAFGYLPPSL